MFSGARKEGLFARLRAGLAKTHDGFINKVERLVLRRNRVDAELLDELEELYLQGDVGPRTTEELMERLRRAVARGELRTPEEVLAFLKGQAREILSACAGALALLLAAADTFRAAAADQLEVWGERTGLEVISQKPGSDPAAVVYDTINAALARGCDTVIADTAGRMHTKVNLMEEMKKIRRTAAKLVPGAPHETLLVLDATTGQNAFSQLRLFHEAVGLTGLVLTKLDGTARGGVVLGLAREFPVPVKLVGVGEKIEDLQDFDPDAFVDALYSPAAG